jgi:hypothetical protein
MERCPLGVFPILYNQSHSSLLFFCMYRINVIIQNEATNRYLLHLPVLFIRNRILDIFSDQSRSPMKDKKIFSWRKKLFKMSFLVHSHYRKNIFPRFLKISSALPHKLLQMRSRIKCLYEGFEISSQVLYAVPAAASAPGK